MPTKTSRLEMSSAIAVSVDPKPHRPAVSGADGARRNCPPPLGSMASVGEYSTRSETDLRSVAVGVSSASAS
jgi:hypothetical protein